MSSGDRAPVQVDGGGPVALPGREDALRAEVLWWNVHRLFTPNSSSLARSVAGPGATSSAREYAAKIDAVAGARRHLLRRRTPAVVALGEVEYNAVVRGFLAALRRGFARRLRLPTRSTGPAPSKWTATSRCGPCLFNPTWQLLTGTRPPLATCRFGGEWYLFDQVLLSPGLVNGGGVQYVEGSRRIGTSGGGSRSLLTAAGHPAPLNPRTGRGASDHLPLLFSLELGRELTRATRAAAPSSGAGRNERRPRMSRVRGSRWMRGYTGLP